MSNWLVQKISSYSASELEKEFYGLDELGSEILPDERTGKNRPVVVDGKKYNSVTEAEDAEGISFYWRIKNQIKGIGNQIVVK